jgi:hypothetical protein
MARQMRITREAVNEALNRKRFAWVDGVMKDELPTDIYGAMHSRLAVDRVRAVCWMNEKGYRVCDEGDGVMRVLKGTVLVRQTKLVLELTNPEEMLTVMEVMAENIKNIPPPPWQLKEQP